MMLFIELNEDGEGFAVGPGPRYLLLLSFYFLTSFVLGVRCFTVHSALYLSPLYVVERNTDTRPRVGGCSVASPSKRLQHDATPSWNSMGLSQFSLSDRIRPPSVSPQPIRSEKGKSQRWPHQSICPAAPQFASSMNF